MVHTEMSWRAEDGAELFAQVWEPRDEARGVVCLVHGLGEHSGRYAHVAQAFTAAGYALVTFDLRGHGKSGGKRGDVPDFEAFMDDIDLLIRTGQERCPGKPCFLYGHSMGGLLVLNYGVRRKPALNGIIATASGLRTPLSDQKAKIWLSTSLAGILPTVSLPTGLDATQISRDQAVVDAYTSDPLVHDRTTFRMARGTLNSIPWVFDHAHEIETPLLLMHGTADQITYARGTQEFASRVTCDCQVRIWDGLKHELHNEPEKEAVIRTMIEWMDAHCPEPAPPEATVQKTV